MPVNPQIYTARLPGGGAALMDIRTGRGRWRHLNPTAAHLWNRIADGSPIVQALEEATAHFTRLGADHDNVRADLEALAGRLHDAGLLSARSSPPPEPVAPTVRFTLPTGAHVPTADRIAGAVALAGALVLLRCAPIRLSITLARALACLPRQAASAERAELLVHAVQRAGRAWAGRVACLEESFAAYLAAWLRGRCVTWVIGARTAPAAAHAWIEADGAAIGQDPADRVWPYAPALRI